MKRAIVTGANSGLGKATAKGLAEKNYEVIMVCRNKERCDAAREEIVEETGNENVHTMLCDLSSQKSIRDFAKKFKRRYKKLHVLVNNAGVVKNNKTFTEEGIETVFAVNHLGYFLLTNLLLDVIKKSAPSRIVNVASGVHITAKLNFDDIQVLRGWSGYKSYANSKLANIYFTYELARRLEGTGVTANCLSPGLVKSNLFRNRGLPWIFRIMKWLIGKTPEEGAETIVFLATSPQVEGVTGKYFENCKEKKTSRISYDEDIAKRLWEVSKEMSGLSKTV